MNLKESFRFQNKLQYLMDEAHTILNDDRNVTRRETTILRRKVMAEAENETTVAIAPSEYANRITEVCSFLIFLMAEEEKLSRCIRATKAKLPIDMDSEVSLNRKRQLICGTLRGMVDLRNSEVLRAGGGTAYRFNADGNQVSYCCDAKLVTTINFDRNHVRALLTELSQKADSISAKIDQCLVNYDVDYEIPFDVNDSFAAVFEDFTSRSA